MYYHKPNTVQLFEMYSIVRCDWSFVFMILTWIPISQIMISSNFLLFIMMNQTIVNMIKWNVIHFQSTLCSILLNHPLNLLEWPGLIDLLIDRWDQHRWKLPWTACWSPRNGGEQRHTRICHLRILEWGGTEVHQKVPVPGAPPSPQIQNCQKVGHLQGHSRPGFLYCHSHLIYMDVHCDNFPVEVHVHVFRK